MKQNIMRSAFGPPILLGSALGLVLCTPSLALAHVVPGQGGGFLNGVAHPLVGLDHICAMIAVGLFAAQRGGKALWLVPAAFVSVMAIGGIIGMATGPLPMVDRGIAMSVLVLGVMVAAAVRLPLVASMAVVGLFALLHGHAHGAEAGAPVLLFGLGFITSTIMLHVAGIGFGLSLQRLGQLQLVRFTGAAIALCGVFLLMV